MTTPLLINTVVPTKIYHIYTAEWRWITDFPGDTAHQALDGAQKQYGPQCKVAVITTAVIKDHYGSNNRNTSRSTPGSGPPHLTPPPRGLATLGATVSPSKNDSTDSREASHRFRRGL